jgi:hypothetical protein
MEKKDSTGFGDLDDATAEEQLMKICKFWYFRMPMYMTDFRHDLLPVIGDSSLVHPGAELNSDSEVWKMGWSRILARIALNELRNMRYSCLKSSSERCGRMFWIKSRDFGFSRRLYRYRLFRI